MIRVLEVLATLKRAGAENLVASLVSRFDRSRFECQVVTLFNATEGDLAPEVEASGVRVLRLGKRPGFDPRMYPRLRAVIKAFRPHIIHTHSYVMRYTWPVTTCRGVHTVHNLADKEVDRIGRWVHDRAFTRGVQAIAVSGVVARSFGGIYKFLPPVIRNGVDVDRFRRRPDVGAEWRMRHGFAPEDKLIVSVARLEPQKNPMRLVQALPVGCRLLLVGDGSLRPALEGLERVHLLGTQTNVTEILWAADAFALASDYEGHPIALMEAMAAGLPVVATPVGGVPEIVDDAGILAEAEGVRAALEAALRQGRELGE
ncbi:MAG TPA: glycosyltransferase, partial [Bryobacteraceae bacterium]|nr:glycosyltransferase [Bryobacteraceae bacterium]